MARIYNMQNGSYRLRYRVNFMIGWADKRRKFTDLFLVESQLLFAKEIEWKTKFSKFTSDDIGLWEQKKLIKKNDAELLRMDAELFVKRDADKLEEKLEEQRLIIRDKDHEIKKLKKLIKMIGKNQTIRIETNHPHYIQSDLPLYSTHIRNGITKISGELASHIACFPMKALNSSPSVYFLLDNGKLQKIGETIDLPARIKSHLSNPDLDFNDVLYIPAPKDERGRREIEKRLIEELKPPKNRSLR